MKAFRLCYFSATSTEITSLSGGVCEYQEKIGPVKVVARTRGQLFDDARIEAFVREAMASDLIVVSLHGGRASCPAFDALIGAMEAKRAEGEKSPHLHIQPTGGDEDAVMLARDHADGFGGPVWETIERYLSCGGSQNFYNLLIYLCNYLNEQNLDPAPPRKPPHEGIYHPDFGGITDTDDYLENHMDPSKITVGLWFYQSYLLNNDLAHIDRMIREIEGRGANVIPVFHIRYPDRNLGNRGADYVVERFFFHKGKPRIDVLLNPMMFSMTLNCPDYAELLKGLNVPFIQAIISMTPRAVWEESLQGISTMEVSFSAAQPEFDGALISVPIATREEMDIDPVTGALLAKLTPLPDRVEKVVGLALNWARLGRKENREKRIAIVFHHYPPRNDRIGCAAGLDSFQSVKHLVDRMKAEGYGVERNYENGDELAKEMLSRMTCDRRWLTPDRMAQRTEAKAGSDAYIPWHEELPHTIQQKMKEDWGEIPGDLFVHEGEMLFPGAVNGNLFITIQPPRGYLENVDKIYHDFYLSPPHTYLAHYRWIRDVFKADAVMHVGKHGSLEWLPGKALGLSETCYPDLSIMDLPNVYPYIINDPSEGTQAKRRSFCCIVDHLTPPFTNADLYEELAKVENILKDYGDARREDPGKCDVIRPMLWEAVSQADLDKDLSITKEEAFRDFENFLERLHAHLGEVSDTMINDGLHIMGQVPEGPLLVEFLVQLTRIANGDVPSLRESVLSAWKMDYDELSQKSGKPVFGGKTGREVIRSAHEKAVALILDMETVGFDPDRIESIATFRLGEASPPVCEVMKYIAETLVPNILKVTDEMDACLSAFDGGFVPPGPSGAPTRGQADILPTGRNFYSVDPQKIPSPGAWEVGVRMGDALIERHHEDTGRYPESIGIILFGGSTMRSKGDDLAEILYLMGVKPVWQKGSGNVTGLTVIPHAELGRPRLDVVPRISGFFRDAFPNLVELMDQAVAMVAALDEAPSVNILRHHVYRDREELMARGMEEEEALREATFRVFGCPPGTYGAGVEELVESKNWETADDLAENYIRYSSHAYGKGSYGQQKPEVFRKVLSRMDVTVKNEDSREYDMFSCTDYYNYYGGLIAASRSVRGELPFALVGDSADPNRPKVRTTFEETRHIFRARLLNPKWLEGMKRHGYKGAGDISKMMDVILGWDATADVVEEWMYRRVAQKYALDPAMKEWLRSVNPYALQNILDKLLEAVARGMWDAGDQMENDLREAYLEIEGDIEEATE